MSRAAGPALGVRRSAFNWILCECSLTRLGPSKVLVNSRLMATNLGVYRGERFEGKITLRYGDFPLLIFLAKKGD